MSGEMISRAKKSLADLPNVFLYQNSGQDLSVLPSLPFDFAFSTIVFQHIPSHRVIENYVSEVSQRLAQGDLFKFQVQGYDLTSGQNDTWTARESRNNSPKTWRIELTSR